jgi:hypothetical protein
MIAEQLAYQPPDSILWLEAVQNLAEMVEDDPVSMLAQAAEWLTPVITEDENSVYDYHGDEALETTCGIVRRQWFDRWLDALEILKAKGQAQFEHALQDIICDELNVHVFDVFGFCGSGYVPFAAVGVDIEHYDYEDSYEEYHLITDLISPACDSETERLVAAIVRSLEAQPGHIYQNVAMTLRWLYTGTGNALFDAGEEEIAEWGIEPFSWEQYDDAFDVQQEAIDFLEMAIQGRKILEDDDLFFHCFAANVKYARDMINHGVIEPVKEGKGFLEHVKYTIPLDWATFNGESGKYRTETQTHADLLRPWRVSADEQHGIRG